MEVDCMCECRLLCVPVYPHVPVCDWVWAAISERKDFCLSNCCGYIFPLNLSLSFSLSHFSLVSIFSLNFALSLSPPADFLSGSHLSFFSLSHSLHFLVLDINRDLTLRSSRDTHTHTHMVHVKVPCLLK